MFSRICRFTGPLVFFLFLFGHIPAQVSDGTFPFYDKATQYYRNEILASKGKGLSVTGPDTSQWKNPAANDFMAVYKASWEIGVFFLELGKHPQAFDIFNSIRIFYDSKTEKSEDDKKRLSSVLNVIGAVYEETGLWNEALDLYMNSLQVCNEIDFKPGKAKVYNNIGKLYFNRKELAKAEELFQKAIDINKELNIKEELFNNYNNLAGIYLLKKDLDKALDIALIALNQLDLKNDLYNQSIAYSNIGNLYQEMKNYPVAISYYRLSADIQEKNSFSVALFRTLLSMASVFEAMNAEDSTTAYLDNTLDLSAKIGNPSLELIILQEAARYYLKSNDYKQSAIYYSRYTVLSDSLESLNSLTKMEQIQAVYEVINKQKDNQILQQKIHLQHLAIQRQRIILIAVSSIFILLAYFIFTLLRNRKRERAQNELLASQTATLHSNEKEMMLQKEHNLELELDYKNRQLTSHALNLARNNELIHKTSDELKSILSGIGARDKERSKKIRNLLSTLHQYSTGNDWEEFRLYFQEVHQSFEKNLTAAYPSLTQNDKKICALLRLGLSTKDIASITFRELRSVESARNRLRKKLGLSSDTNIITFLSQY